MKMIRPCFSSSSLPYWYSAGLHVGLILLFLIFSYHPSFLLLDTGVALHSKEEVQMVNATLVLPTPSPSRVIAPAPAPAPPTPPVKRPSSLVHPNPPVKTPSPLIHPSPPVKTASPLVHPRPPSLSTPTPDKSLPQKHTEDQAKPVQKQHAEAKNTPSTLENKQVLQNLKALGLSSIKEALDSKNKEAASAAERARDLTLQEKYMGLIQQTVRSNWINQFDTEVNLTVTLQIALSPNGDVLSVRISKTSGNAAFDRQAVLAVQKSSPLPLPPDPSLARDFLTLTLPFSNHTP